MAKIDTKWVDLGAATPSAGDDASTSFSLANNQSTPSVVTGLGVSDASSTAFKMLIYIEIDASSNLYEVREWIGVRKPTGWVYSEATVGDDTGVDFSWTDNIVYYTTPNYAGFTSAKVTWRTWALDR